MAYSELVKNFNKIRDYMREFYVYGFKSRDEYNSKSARSYDDERRRLESWLGDYMQFRKSAEGKNVFISIDSRLSRHNPLYRAWKTKSFTDGDIMLHFILLDILYDENVSLSLGRITEKIDEYLSHFKKPRMFDESTVRKKLKEYVGEGIIIAGKRGKSVYYRRASQGHIPGKDVLDYYSETAPCGVIGSFLLDRYRYEESAGGAHNAACSASDNRDDFAFKHHYITDALDSDILCTIFAAIREKREVTVETINRGSNHITEKCVLPLQVMYSVQNGRQYVMSYMPRYRRIMAFRTDNIISVKPGDVSDKFDELRATLNNMRRNMWGVSTQSFSGSRLEHVEFTIRYADDEQYIRRRLEREKRIGRVEITGTNTCRFSADVYDTSELIPWIRTFICRIEHISFSNKQLEQQFRDDMNAMYEMYGID